jgi:putative PIN family toxin of toxin-antitoxin system
LIEEAVDGQIELVVPAVVLGELRRVLTVKLGLSVARWQEVETLLNELAAAVPEAPEAVDQVSGDPDDDLVLASAIAAQADVLASGDRRHLLPLGSHRGLRILTPQALLAELAGR